MSPHCLTLHSTMWMVLSITSVSHGMEAITLLPLVIQSNFFYWSVGFPSILYSVEVRDTEIIRNVCAASILDKFTGPDGKEYNFDVKNFEPIVSKCVEWILHSGPLKMIHFRRYSKIIGWNFGQSERAPVQSHRTICLLRVHQRRRTDWAK